MNITIFVFTALLGAIASAQSSNVFNDKQVAQAAILPQWSLAKTFYEDGTQAPPIRVVRVWPGVGEWRGNTAVQLDNNAVCELKNRGQFVEQFYLGQNKTPYIERATGTRLEHIETKSATADAYLDCPDARYVLGTETSVITVNGQFFQSSKGNKILIHIPLDKSPTHEFTDPPVETITTHLPLCTESTHSHD